MGLPNRRLPTALAIATALVLVLAACGGSGDSSTSEEDVITQVEAACTKLSGYSVWLPEHLEKAGMSTAQGEAIVDRASDEFRATLASLDPPSGQREPIEELAEPAEEPKTRAELRASLKRLESLYEQVGAERCAESARASLLSFDGASVEDAYDSVGLPLPPHPDGW